MSYIGKRTKISAEQTERLKLVLRKLSFVAKSSATSPNFVSREIKLGIVW